VVYGGRSPDPEPGRRTNHRLQPQSHGGGRPNDPRRALVDRHRLCCACPVETTSADPPPDSAAQFHPVSAPTAADATHAGTGRARAWPLLPRFRPLSTLGAGRARSTPTRAGCVRGSQGTPTRPGSRTSGASAIASAGRHDPRRGPA